MRRFSASSKRTGQDFYKLMIVLKATSLKINPSTEMNANGTIKSRVEVVFDRNSIRYMFVCDKWQHMDDNLRAIYHTIRVLYKAIAEYGVVKTQEKDFNEIFEKMFGGFIATPDDSVLRLPSGSKMWFEILGVELNATRQAIQNAYRALAKVHHPDAGGNAETFKRLRDAYETGLKAVKQ